jgi:membrane-associated phospholipid phosphatase
VTWRARYRQVMPVILALYVLCVVIGFLYLNMRLTVEWVAAILLVAALLTGRMTLFIKDWGVFIAVLLAWQVTSPLATRFSFPWHLQVLIDADRFLFFGHVPSLWLQQHLYHKGTLEPWDVLAAAMYMLHFLSPLLAGFVLWIANRDLFGKFAVTFVLCAFAGFVTYILFPAVPPWMAAQPLVHVGNEYLYPWVAAAHYPGGLHAAWQHAHRYLPGVQNLFNVDASNWYNPYHGTISLTFLHLHYDSVAAIPSEHAMYPLLFFLFLRRQFGRPAYLALVYIALLLFSITYLGQHYVIDAIVGFAYASAGYVLVMHVYPRVRSAFMRDSRPRPAAVAVRHELEEA